MYYLCMGALRANEWLLILFFSCNNTINVSAKILLHQPGSQDESNMEESPAHP